MSISVLSSQLSSIFGFILHRLPSVSHRTGNMFTCISCRVAFEDASEQRTHFSTDWHRYNMKRRVANLPPVPATAFNEKVIERREQNAVRTDPRGMSCDACR